ncbi:hypothetical protein [Sorangium cellulosum]|uniref:hypothetical protein n=1 Tax=Sorangium cellulosum TaxID=56 RepID=UPI001012CC57|nr:hypothetical protein [Sorangium cellulosum]
MWEFSCYDWGKFDAHRDTSRVPQMLQVLLDSEHEGEWSSALSYLESCASDLGVPCCMTPATVSVLASIMIRVDGKKRSEILSLLEELTCGRGASEYSEAQKMWLRESVQELLLVFKNLVDVMERSSVEDAERCVDMLAYCAEHVPCMTGRVRKYLALCQERFPRLSDEIQAVSEYFSSE